MNFTHPAHREMIIALLENGVDFLLVGGYAVIYHGYVRATGDMDVWLRPTNRNKKLLLKVFEKLQFDREGIKKIDEMDFTSVVIFHIGDEPERIDFLSKVQGLNFDDAYNQRQALNLGDYQIPILHLNDLIANKLLANRLKDRADIEQLMRIQKSRESEK
jgi:predicted nucleotidyltransferase